METILLNLIPTGTKPTCHASQLDKGRKIGIDLFENSKAYEFKEGDAVTLKVLKPDGTGVTADVLVTEGSHYVEITVTQDMSDIEGTNLCELRIVNGNTDIGSSNFYMEIEKAVDSSLPPQRKGGLNTSAIGVTSTTYTTEE